MISRIDRYIGRSVIFSVAAVMLLLLVMIGFFEFLGELGQMERDYTIGKALLYVLLGLPRYTYELFPVATLLGSLVGLGLLANHSELTAMRAAGISVAQILAAVLKSGLVMLLTVILLGEVVAPVAEQRAQVMKMEAISGRILLNSWYGFWTRDGDDYINILTILPDARLADVRIYEYRQRRLKRAIRADLAVYDSDSDGGGWDLQGVRMSEFGPERIRVRRVETLRWPSLLDPILMDVVSVNPNMLAIWDLRRYIGFLRQNGQETATYEMAFWSKLITPLVTLVMLFLSIPFVFGSLRSVSIGQRVFAGALVGIVFYMFNRAFSYLGILYSVPPLLAASIPTLLFFLVAWYFFRRVQ